MDSAKSETAGAGGAEEHRRALAQLGESERRLKAIWETAVESIVTISAEGTMEMANPAAGRLFGYDPAELIGRNVKELMPSPYREEHDGYLDAYLKTGVAKIIGIGREAVGVRKDGSIFPLRLAVSEVRLPDRILFTGFIEDLTERKRLEREAEEWREELERRVEHRTAALARANEELEHFAHTISHDLRTPLRGIRNYVDFLTEDLAGKVEGESAEDLRRLGRAAEELDRMIQELLDYTRIGRSKHSIEEIDVNTLLRDIGSVLTEGPGALRRAVRIPAPLPRLWAPPGTLRQIFQNLIENGLTYNQSATPEVEIRAEPRPGDPARWIFSVRDNGIGIDPAYHHKIFGMFQRLQTADHYPGTGIGLAAVRKAAQHLGGEVRVESAPGKGSVFFVELPERAESPDRD